MKNNTKFIPSMDPLLYYYAFNFNALVNDHPEQYPIWIHSHAELLKTLSSKGRGYVPVGLYLGMLHTKDLFDAASWYRERIDATNHSFNWSTSSELTHVAMAHAAMVAHMEGATFLNDNELTIAADRLYALLVFEARYRANDFSSRIEYSKVTLDPNTPMTRYITQSPSA